MERWGAHHSSVFFLLIISSLAFSLEASPTTLAVSSFKECYPDWGLTSFWTTDEFKERNINIQNTLIGDIYHIAFDSSLQGLGLQSAGLMDARIFEMALPSEDKSTFSDAGITLNTARSSLQAAQTAVSNAHAVSLAMQPLVYAELGLTPPYPSGTLVSLYPPLASMAKALVTLGSMPARFDYMQKFPGYYEEALTQSSHAYASVESAARAVASKADEEYDFLTTAGAGSENYSTHAVRDAYSSSLEYLSTGQRCQQDLFSSYKIAGFFSESWQNNVPNFIGLGFSSHLSRIASDDPNSSIMQMAALHASLKSAHAAMEKEYADASASATKSKDDLAAEVKALTDDDIDLIGDVPVDADTGKVQVGASYAGVLTGYANLKKDLKDATDDLTESAVLYGNNKQQNYLADAIALAKKSETASANALVSVPLIRASAETAVVVQGRLADKKITDAQAKIDGLPSTPEGMAAKQLANPLLEEAKDFFNSASSAKTHGSKFVAYRSALDKATEALEAASGTYDISTRQKMDITIKSVSSFLSLVQSDGLDVKDAQDTLSEYQQVANGPLSVEEMKSIIATVQELKNGAVLLLETKYSSLGEDYATASSKFSELHKQDKAFVSPELGSLSAYFKDGKLSGASAAGHISKIKTDLEKIASDEEKRTESYLSGILSKNARLSLLPVTPGLGSETTYSGEIYTENPGSISSDLPISFSVSSEVPLYSSDFIGGDSISNAYPENGKTAITLPSVAASASFSFKFEKKDSPAQITTTSVECKEAAESDVQVDETVSFLATRDLPVLSVLHESPSDVSDAYALHSGRRFSLKMVSSEAGSALDGTITNVKGGARTVEFHYTVRKPFSVTQGERAYVAQAGGAKKTSYPLEIINPAIDCDSAIVSIDEPYSASSFAVSSLGMEKASQTKAAEGAGSTRLSFVFSPLRKGKSVSFTVSYVISDPQSALKTSLEAAQLQVDTYHRSKDSLTLDQAKLLSSQNRTEEALSVLSKMLQEGAQITSSYADYAQFQEEKSDAESLAEKTENMARQLSANSGSNQSSALSGVASAEQSAQLSSLASKLRSSLASATSDAESKGYTSALQSVRKAVGDFSTSLSSLAWKSVSDAQDGYAAARKKSSAHGLEAVERQITEALKFYSDGDHLQSFQSSSSALRSLSQALDAAGEQDEIDKQSAEGVRADFTALQKQTEELLSKYSSQYSALSGTSKSTMAITPSEAQKKLDDAQKSLAASSKSTLTPQQSLAAANASLGKLQSAYDTLQSSYTHLQTSASNSLGVAKIALAQVKSEASGVSPADAKQIEAEVSKAEGFLAASLYSDSLLSSERAIKAANAVLDGKGTGSLDIKTLLLAALSLVFLCVAAYYFITKARKPSQKKEKRELPKSE